MQQLCKSSVLYKNGAWVSVDESNLIPWIAKSYNDLGKCEEIVLRLVQEIKKQGFTMKEKGLLYKKMKCTILNKEPRLYTTKSLHCDYPLKNVDYGEGGKQFLADYSFTSYR